MKLDELRLESKSKPPVQLTGATRALVFATLVSVFAGLFIADNALGQRRFQNDTRESPAILGLLKDVSSPSANSVCSILQDEKQVALGVLICDGLVVTKHSELNQSLPIRCAFPGQDSSGVTAEIAAMDGRYDMALLRVDTSSQPLSESLIDSTRPEQASMVFSVNRSGTASALGMISTPARQFRTRQFNRPPRAFLGVQCSPLEDESGLQVQSVTRQSAALSAGLRRNDVILTLDSEPLAEVQQLVRRIRRKKPGDKIQLSIRRGEDQRFDVEATLGDYPSSLEQDKWGGGPFSERRFGFPQVIAHDCIIKTNQCGGPLLNLQGKVVGINIARALRITTYAVPIGEVIKFVEANKPRQTSSQ